MVSPHKNYTTCAINVGSGNTVGRVLADFKTRSEKRQTPEVSRRDVEMAKWQKVVAKLDDVLRDNGLPYTSSGSDLFALNH